MVRECEMKEMEESDIWKTRCEKIGKLAFVKSSSVMTWDEINGEKWYHKKGGGTDELSSDGKKVWNGKWSRVMNMYEIQRILYSDGPDR